MNKDGTFSVTDLARHTLWSEKIPLWVRILRLLEIKSYNIELISNVLKNPEDQIFKEIEKLRKNHLVLMSPIRQESKIIKMYEILPEGIEKIKEVEESGFQNNRLVEIKPKTEILGLINEIKNEVNELEFDKKKDIILKLDSIKEKLETNLF